MYKWFSISTYFYFLTIIKTVCHPFYIVLKRCKQVFVLVGLTLVTSKKLKKGKFQNNMYQNWLLYWFNNCWKSNKTRALVYIQTVDEIFFQDSWLKSQNYIASLWIMQKNVRKSISLFNSQKASNFAHQV